jgi:imidazolonepropionase-like amidohydrolase
MNARDSEHVPRWCHYPRRHTLVVTTSQIHSSMLGMENHLHREFELLVEAGLPPLEDLRAATILPAQVLQFSDRGVIEEVNRTVLNRAVLVFLREDPTEDISATRGIDRVLCGGLILSSP